MILRRRKRKVRMHIAVGDAKETVDGVLVGRTSGHYVLWAPAYVGDAETTVSMDGHAEIPCRNVILYQVLG